MPATALAPVDSAPQVLDREAERIVRDLELPPCPEVLVRFGAEMKKDEPDLHVLSDLILTDPGLAVAMLRTVNAPFFGLAKKVASVQHALAVLGLRAAGQLVTGLLLRRAFPQGDRARLADFWDGASRIAQTALVVASRLRRFDREEAHTYALFRDCGVAVLVQRFPAYVIPREVHNGEEGLRALAEEEERYGASHARIGRALAASWHLPTTLSDAILVHHDLRLARMGGAIETQSRRLVAFGLLADQINALRAGAGLRADWPEMEEYVFDALSVTAEQMVGFATLLGALKD